MKATRTLPEDGRNLGSSRHRSWALLKCMSFDPSTLTYTQPTLFAVGTNAALSVRRIAPSNHHMSAWMKEMLAVAV
jgi:hypothetical protein